MPHSARRSAPALVIAITASLAMAAYSGSESTAGSEFLPTTRVLVGEGAQDMTLSPDRRSAIGNGVESGASFYTMSPLGLETAVAVDDELSSLAFSEDGTTAAALSWNESSVHILDVAAKTRITTTSFDESPAAVAAGDSRFFVSLIGGSGLRTIEVLDATTGEIVNSLRDEDGTTHLVYVPATKRVIAQSYLPGDGGNDLRLHVYDPETGVTDVSRDLPFYPEGLKTNPSGDLLYAAVGKSLYELDPATLKTTKRYKIGRRLNDFVFSADGKAVYLSGERSAGGGNQNLGVYRLDLATGSLESHRVKSPSYGLVAADVPKAGQLLLSNGRKLATITWPKASD